MTNKVDNLTLERLSSGKIIGFVEGDFTAYLSVNYKNNIHVMLWKSFEQNDGEMNNYIVYIDFYPNTDEGLDKAKEILSKSIERGW